MKAIFKYPLLPTGHLIWSAPVSMPEGARVISVGEQNGGICAWAIVDPDAPMEVRRFEVYPTGHTLSDEDLAELEFLATVQTPPYVWHVFERRAK